MGCFGRCAALFVTGAACVLAQTTEASISGTVRDPQGAFIPGVEIAATHVETGVRAAVKTNEAGFYSIRPLPIGPYTVTAGMQGFRKHERSGLVLTTGQALELNIVLEIGALTESVTVSASASLLETRSSDASQLVESKTIEEMPLGDRRAMNLIEITGAAVFVNYDSGSKPNFSLAGGRTQSQMFWIDGGSGQNMRIGVGQIDMDPPIDSLQEVKIMGNGFSAEYGGSAGGVIIATTKSGTNQFHGTASEYLRNQVMDAPNLFAPVVDGRKDKPSLRYNVFGATIGGPLRRDRTFFFFSYEGSRRRDGSIRTLTVPSLLERRGDFTQTYTARGLSIIYDPFTGRREDNQTVRDPFPGNVVPSSRFDPVGKNLVPFFPAPNRAPDDRTGANNFRANDVNALTRNNYAIKVDHNWTSANKFTIRYLYNSDISKRNSVYPEPAADTNNQNDYHQQYWYGSWTRIVTPNAINEMRFTYGRRFAHTFSRGYGGNWPSKIGLKGVSDDAFPNIAPANYAALGNNTQDRRQFPIEQMHFVNNLSWVRGRQAWKFGGEVRPSRNHEIFRPTPSGRYVFSRGITGTVGNAFTGNGFATLLLGVPTTFEMRETPDLRRRSRYLGWFVQNDWTVHPNLTLNIGVRWEADTPLRDLENRINSFDPLGMNPVSGTPGVVKFLGRGGWRSTPYDADWNNFGPRFGFAWRVFGLNHTVVRGGFGIFYAHPFDRAVANAASLGFERSANLTFQDNVAAVPYTLAGGLPIPPLTDPVLDDAYGAVPLGTTATRAVTYFETRRRTGYSQQSNLRIQHELPGGALFEIGYVGNLSRKLASANIGTNQIRPERMGPGTGQRDRPFPQYTDVTIIAPAFGVSSYHAGVAKVEKRFSRGFNILATFTWAKFLDNCDGGAGASLGDEPSAYSNYYNRRPDWGPSENDIRRRLTWSSVYQLPFGRKYLRRHWSRYVIGNWSAGSVIVVQSGPPLTITTQTNTTYSNSSGALRADVIRDPNLPGAGRSLRRWFDTEAFVQPAPYTFGNQGVGVTRAPGLVNVNASINRTFRVGERKNLQFRGELFNVPNHPNLGLPAHRFEGSGFGIINSAKAGRQVQLGLRLTY
ncbi:MAG: carboxypeptidase regulatory-like domain-containing protein [Bryobacteraceae bacterium]